jgi:hypothetical protein
MIIWNFDFKPKYDRFIAKVIVQCFFFLQCYSAVDIRKSFFFAYKETLSHFFVTKLNNVRLMV